MLKKNKMDYIISYQCQYCGSRGHSHRECEKMKKDNAREVAEVLAVEAEEYITDEERDYATPKK